MRKRLVMLALLLAAAANWAQAQVAVPELVPAGVRIFNSRFQIMGSTISFINPMLSIVPENPAALQWGSPSRIGAGALKGDMSDVGDGDSSTYKGSFAGFRWIKQRVALAADSMHYDVHLANSGGTLTDLARQRQSVALSFSLPQSLAWGLGSRSLKYEETKPSSSSIDSSGWNFGLSWRIGQILFIGAGVGHDNASLVLPPAPPAGFVGDAQRDYRMAGLGLRGNGSVVWHLEADSIHHDAFVDGSGKPHLPGYDLALYVAEVQFGNWLFGYSQHAIKDLPPSGQPSSFRVNGYTADFGYAPFKGITITGRTELSRREMHGMQLAFERIRSAAVLWQF